MPILSDRSLKVLEGCHPDLQKIVMEAIKIYDFSVLEGYRDEEAQRRAVVTGHSRTPWPTSKHNLKPSVAVDLAPYPLDWDDWKRFYYLGGLIMATAAALRIPLRWGGDFNQNNKFDDDFRDLPHFELIKQVGAEVTV